MAKDFRVEVVDVDAGRAAAEELRCGRELLVDLESADEADLAVVGFAHFSERTVGKIERCLGARIEIARWLQVGAEFARIAGHASSPYDMRNASGDVT